MKLRKVLIIAAFPVAILLNIWLGRLDDPQTVSAFSPPPPPDVETLLKGVEVPAQQQMELQFLAADGSPAVNALVVASEPNLVSGQTDSNGKLSLPWWDESPAALMAWLPGHRVFSASEFDPQQKRVFQFIKLNAPEIEFAKELEERDITCLVVEADSQNPVTGAILLLAAEEEDVPSWLALSDDSGKAVFDSVSQQQEEIRIFAPGMPPTPAWELPSKKVGGLIEVNSFTVSCKGLEPNSLLFAERFYEHEWHPLPMKLSSGNGLVAFTNLPPGTYRFKNGDQEIEKTFVALRLEGLQTIEFSSATRGE